MASCQRRHHLPRRPTRIVTILVYEMARRDASLGLISVCAAGAMAGAMILERP